MARWLRMTGGVTLGVLWLGASGCAGVRVYSDPAMTHETGVKVFAPRPYLLVSRTGAKDNPVELSIVYLPDPADVIYIRQQRGWGSNDLGIGINNGMLTQFGTKNDAQLPQGVSAMGSLLTAAAGAYNAARAPMLLRATASGPADANAASKMLALIAQDFVTATAVNSPATSSQAAAARTIADALSDATASLSDPNSADPPAVATTLASLLPQVDTLRLADPPTGNNRFTAYNSTIDSLKVQLQAVIAGLDPRALADAAFELYEIRQERGATRLVRVAIEK